MSSLINIPYNTIKVLLYKEFLSLLEKADEFEILNPVNFEAYPKLPGKYKIN